MNSSQFRKFLKARISKRKDKKFLAWAVERKSNPTNDLHHIIGKRNDYLLAEVNHKLHLQDPNVFDTYELLLDAMERIFDYIEYLERKNTV